MVEPTGKAVRPDPAGEPAGEEPAPRSRVHLKAALVLTLLVTVFAGALAGIYAGLMANPHPRSIPVMVVGRADTTQRVVRALDRQLDSAVEPMTHGTYRQALAHVEHGGGYAVLQSDGPGQVRLELSDASSPSVATLLRTAAQNTVDATGVPVHLADRHPMQTSDPQGTALFYLTFAATGIGFLGAGQFASHIEGLTATQRIGFLATSSLLGGLCIHTVAERLLGVLHMPLVLPWAVLSLAMFASAMMFTALHGLFGKWAMLPGYVLTVLVGTPSSGGSVPTALLPAPLRTLGDWLPQGAAMDGMVTSVYFPEGFPLLALFRLTVVALVCTLLYVAAARRSTRPAPAPGRLRGGLARAR
ncbi:ABC transporter permease [Streptomyces indicus]|nr:ABC transporter permease [Streptomyces indicus]